MHTHHGRSHLDEAAATASGGAVAMVKVTSNRYSSATDLKRHSHIRSFEATGEPYSTLGAL